MLNRHLTIAENTKPPLLKDEVFVTSDSCLVDANGNLIALEFSAEGEAQLELDWFDGKRKYAAALLVLHVFKPVHVPLMYWNSIKALYMDGNKTNLHYDNLVWWFPPQTIAYDKLPGFYYVPGATRYAVDRTGVTYNIPHDKYVTQHFLKGPGSYANVSLKCDDNQYYIVS